MGLTGIEEDGTEGEGTKADMTDHVKDIHVIGLSFIIARPFPADLLSLLTYHWPLFLFSAL